MKREFLIDRQGKTFVLYAGLLDAAHAAGLKAIRTRLVQAPAKENGETTIVVAEVEFEDGRVFSGIGDATPTNVGRNIAPHAVRMAETRAKARALRDALNIGAVALEELGDDDEPPAARPNGPAPRSAVLPASTSGAASRMQAEIESLPATRMTDAEVMDAVDPPPRLVEAEEVPAHPEYRRAVTAIQAAQALGMRVPRVPTAVQGEQVWTGIANQWEMAVRSRKAAR